MLTQRGDALRAGWRARTSAGVARALQFRAEMSEPSRDRAIEASSFAELDSPKASPTTVLLAILTVVVVGFALRHTVSVTLPLAFGLFVACLAWPMMRALSRRLPRAVAVTFVTLALIAIAVGFGWALFETGRPIHDTLVASEAQLTRAFEGVREGAAQVGVPMDDVGGGTAWLERGARVAVEVFAGILLVIAFASLALFETRETKDKVRRATREHHARVIAFVDRTSAQLRRYFWVRTLVGALSGLSSALGAWALGLEHAWLWGVMGFLLNYIPTIGSALSVIPPALYAIVQFDGDLTMALWTILVLGVIQLVMGNWVDPLLEGRVLSLSPLVVLFSVVFWGWVWGVAGALVGVPMTMLIVLLCREHEGTRWIAILLAGPEEHDAEEEGDERAPTPRSSAPVPAR